MPRFRKDLDQIPRYVPGKPIDEVTRELGLSDVVKLASNEFPVAPFPEVQAAIAAAAAEVHRYPEDSGYYLAEELATRFDTARDHIWLGAGSTQLIRSISAAAGGPGTATVYAWPSFVGYRIANAMAGGEAIEIPLDNGAHDLDGMLEAIRDDTTLVYICNPNNPTATTVPDTALSDFLAAVDPDVLVVVDEAYHEFATAPDYASQADRALATPNVVVLRTFSKVYGLAGLRVGYALGQPDVLDSLRHTQLPFVVNSIALVAALEALQFPNRVAERVEAIAAGRDYIEAAFAARGIEYWPSQTNFIAFLPGTSPGSFSKRMLHEGVIVRPLGGLVRVTVGLAEENERFVAALDKVRADTHAGAVSS